MDSNPHATPQDTLAALRTRISRELADLAEELMYERIPLTWLSDGFERDARLKLALLDEIEKCYIPPCNEPVAFGLQIEHRRALRTLRLLAESAGEAVAW